MSSSERRNRPKSVLTRLTEDEYAELTSMAEATGLTRADYLRSAGLEKKPLGIKRRPAADHVELTRILKQFGKIGSNLNQIARNMNRGRREDEAFVRDSLKSVVEMKDALFAALGIDPTGGKPRDR
jgi:hypothetical protein